MPPHLAPAEGARSAYTTSPPPPPFPLSGTTPDFQALLDMAAGPSIELLDGKLSIDLSAMASSEITLLTSYISDSNYQFALRMVGFFSITDFLNTIPGVRAWRGGLHAAMGLAVLPAPPSPGAQHGNALVTCILPVQRPPLLTTPRPLRKRAA